MFVKPVDQVAVARQPGAEPFGLRGVFAHRPLGQPLIPGERSQLHFGAKAHTAEDVLELAGGKTSSTRSNSPRNQGGWWRQKISSSCSRSGIMVAPILAVDSDDIDIFVKTLANGDKAVAIFNRTDAPIDAVLTAQHLKFRGDADVALTDLWSGEALRFTGDKIFRLAAHEARIFTARGKRELADGLYLSEMPGRVNPAVDGVVVPQAEPLVRRSLLPWRGSKGNGEPPRYGGWGGPQPDRSVYGETLATGGRSFESGIGTLANSRIEVRATGFSRFTALVGVDDSARDRRQPVTFAVYADGKLRAQSKPMRFGDAPAAITADVRGAQLVELVARTPGGPRFGDPVAWGDAALHR